MRSIQDLRVISEIIYLIIALHQVSAENLSCSCKCSSGTEHWKAYTRSHPQIPPKKPWVCLRNYSSGYFHGIVQRLRTRGWVPSLTCKLSITVKKKKGRGIIFKLWTKQQCFEINDIMSVKRLELLGKKTLHKYKVVLIFRLSPQCETCFLQLMRSPAVW